MQQRARRYAAPHLNIRMAKQLHHLLAEALVTSECDFRAIVVDNKVPERANRMPRAEDVVLIYQRDEIAQIARVAALLADDAAAAQVAHGAGSGACNKNQPKCTNARRKENLQDKSRPRSSPGSCLRAKSEGTWGEERKAGPRLSFLCPCL